MRAFTLVIPTLVLTTAADCVADGGPRAVASGP
jgi:hypothetical protein